MSVYLFHTTGHDTYAGGNYKITGTVTGVNGSRLVLLFTRHNGKVARAMMSSANGAYEFGGLSDKLEYIAMAIDHENIWNCAVADRPPLVQQ